MVTFSADDVRRIARTEEEGPTAGVINSILSEAQAYIYQKYGSFFETYFGVEIEDAELDAFFLEPAPLLEVQLCWINEPSNTKMETTNFVLTLTSGYIDFSGGSSAIDLVEGDLVYVRYFPRILKDAVNYRAAVDVLDAYYHADVGGEGEPSSVRAAIKERLKEIETALTENMEIDSVHPRFEKLWDVTPG